MAWKPGPNQPQPLARGSGEFSLKDLGKVIQQGGKAKSSKNKKSGPEVNNKHNDKEGESCK